MKNGSVTPIQNFRVSFEADLSKGNTIKHGKVSIDASVEGDGEFDADEFERLIVGNRINGGWLVMTAKVLKFKKKPQK